MTPESDDRLRALLREEQELETRLAKIRAEIAPLKFAYATETGTYGLTNRVILQRLSATGTLPQVNQG